MPSNPLLAGTFFMLINMIKEVIVDKILCIYIKILV